MIFRILKSSYSNVLCIVCLVFSPLAALHAKQTGEKVVNANDVEQITDAVLISNISVAGKTVECGLFIKPPVVLQSVTPFRAGTDWLQQMTISLVNRTNKTIIFGAIILHFLDVGDCSVAQPCVGAELHLCQMPTVDAFDGRTGKPLKPEHPERQPLDWRPEQTIVVHVNEYLPEIANDLANFTSVTDIRKVNLSRGVFYFTDGMSWRLGRYAVPNPEHPGKFNELPVNYFPGTWGNNWPPGYNNR